MTYDTEGHGRVHVVTEAPAGHVELEDGRVREVVGVEVVEGDRHGLADGLEGLLLGDLVIVERERGHGVVGEGRVITLGGGIRVEIYRAEAWDDGRKRKHVVLEFDDLAFRSREFGHGEDGEVTAAVAHGAVSPVYKERGSDLKGTLPACVLQASLLGLDGQGTVCGT